ncbi:MAG: DNA primase small subunit domain-containing protein [Candidatus Helarchaeota archaeon]
MSQINKSADFVKKEFNKYYSSIFIKEVTISEIDEREFGFQYWDKSLFQRHFSFFDRSELNSYLLKFNPKHCYSSAALYELPGENDINKKIWTGCDFVIDIDADHVDLPCQSVHDEYVCNVCKKKGKGKPPKICSCKSTSFKKSNWVCEKCLEFSKKETIKIVENFFIPDFGLKEDDFLIKFSGNRGYHIQIQLEDFKNLDQDSRREIANYITGKNIDLNLLDFQFNKKGISGPSRLEKGWRGRVTQYLINFFIDLNEKELNAMMKSKYNDMIIQNRQKFIKNLSSIEPNWNEIKIPNKMWEKIIEYSINKYSGKIDEPVSTDTRRLLRLPNSLHGKTGLQAKIVAFKDIDSFDPLTDALVFDGDVKVKFKRCPEFRLGNYVYGPYQGGEIEIVNKSAAIFSICKGRAELI